ncbi:MAG: hypothetical protein LBE56_12755 [Tannerella sp.]|nr:hypothetical protein [Tannerella sp.]
MVYTKDGQCKKIEDLCKEDGILGFSDGEIIPQNIIQMQKPGYKECVKIEAESGLILECSADHPIMCSNSDNNKWY